MIQKYHTKVSAV